MNAALLEWTDAHRIGIKMLDFEHEDLFARLNELHLDLLSHVDRSKIEACLGEIHASMAAHFALEERYMREKRYADYPRHKAEHDALLEEFVEFMSRFSGDPHLVYGESEQVILKRWVSEHVVSTDRRLGVIAGGDSSGGPG